MDLYLKPLIYKLDNVFYKNELYIMREDLLPFSFGGNKARKALYFFEDINKGKYNHVVTYGSSSSNHCRVVANLCKVYGLKCTIIQPIEQSKDTFNKLLIEEMGAQLVVVPVTDVSKQIEHTILELKEKGDNPYFIQGGGHGNIGTHAYVEAYKNINKYERVTGLKFDRIYFASGTGTTQAGLTVGAMLNDDSIDKIIGISVARKSDYGKNVICDSIDDYLQEYELHNRYNHHKIVFLDDYIKGGYGELDKQITDMQKYCFYKYGIPLDGTYTGKAFWGMKEHIIKNNIINSAVLFIHTGGTPLFFDNLLSGR